MRDYLLKKKIKYEEKINAAFDVCEDIFGAKTHFCSEQYTREQDWVED
jgi:hypothetical protein